MRVDHNSKFAKSVLAMSVERFEKAAKGMSLKHLVIACGIRSAQACIDKKEGEES